ncbi:MAG: hypothetical protein AB7N80_07055 [Bdellovibrionales bacterium]
MNPTIRYYLGEVLGLELVPREAVQKASTQPKVQSQALAILCGHTLNEPEKVLLKKMMQAIGVDDYVVRDVPATGEGIGLVFGHASAESLGLKELGAVIEIDGRRWLRTYSLGDMLNGSDGEIQSRKRVAWAHLQTIKNWLKESQH